MSSKIAIVLILGLLFIGSFAAPTRALAANDLLRNAQDAQDMNSKFAGLKLSDSCSAGDQACVQGNIAKCGSGGNWEVSQLCLTSQSCFALPSLTQSGTNLTCTSDANALSLMKACGTTGTTRSSKDTSSNTTTTSESSKTKSSSKSSSKTKTASSAGTTVTVTQFIPITSGTVTTSLAPSTRTLAPAAASSLIASIMADSGVVVSTISASTTGSSATTSCTSSWSSSKMTTKTKTKTTSTATTTATSSSTSVSQSSTSAASTTEVATTSAVSNGANAITSIATSFVTLTSAST